MKEHKWIRNYHDLYFKKTLLILKLVSSYNNEQKENQQKTCEQFVSCHSDNMYSETQPEHIYLNLHASLEVGKKPNQTKPNPNHLIDLI